MTARFTSVQVYQQIEAEGLLSKMRWQVYSWLFKNGPATGSEVNEGLDMPHGHKRLSELQQQGVVIEVGTKECSVSGREAISWDVTDSLPKTFIPSKRKTKIDIELQEALEENRRLKDLLQKALDRMEEAGLFK
jgi:hypothetical protein